MRLELQDPTATLRDSYRGLVKEFEDRGERLVPFPLNFPHDDFPRFLRRLEASARGEDLPPGFVPHSTYWLVLDGREVVGVSNLRHRLTEKLRREGGHIGFGVRPSSRGRGFATQLLAGTLERARVLGLTRVLLTCAKANVPSARTILKNGGILDSEIFLPEFGEVYQRYWIDLDSGADARADVPDAAGVRRTVS